MQSKYLIILVFFIGTLFSFSQEKNEAKKPSKKEKTIKVEEIPLVLQDSTYREPLNPLSPARAAFYSAVLPGLGQAYNKKYWKIPIFVGGIVGGVLVYKSRNKEYNRFRDAFKRRLAGFKDDEFYGVDQNNNPLATPRISNDALIRAQQTARRNRELAVLITIGIYALNIIDANVDAHLLQYNVDENLAIKPHFKYNEMENSSDLGLTLNFKF